MEACAARPTGVHGETSEVSAKHGRRLNGKTKVTDPNGPWKGMALGSGMIEVKQEADPDGAAEELTPAEMEAMWLQVKQEVKEEMDSEAPPSSVGAAMGSDGDSVKKEVGSEVKIKQEPVDGATPKRRRLSRRELQTSAGLLDLVAIKKEALDRTEVKQEADDQAQELSANRSSLLRRWRPCGLRLSKRSRRRWRRRLRPRAKQEDVSGRFGEERGGR